MCVSLHMCMSVSVSVCVSQCVCLSLSMCVSDAVCSILYGVCVYSHTVFVCPKAWSWQNTGTTSKSRDVLTRGVVPTRALVNPFVYLK